MEGYVGCDVFVDVVVVLFLFVQCFLQEFQLCGCVVFCGQGGGFDFDCGLCFDDCDDVGMLQDVVLCCCVICCGDEYFGFLVGGEDFVVGEDVDGFFGG